MTQRLHIPLLILLWLGNGAWAEAPAVADHTGPARNGGAAHIILGQSAVPLYGPWKFYAGDSPVDAQNHEPLWARPDFDDSQWETVDLTPKNGTFNPIGGYTGYVPGWTAKGHAGYWGYAWYRIRVILETQPGTKLALAGPPDVDDVYQVFDNGKLIGSYGDFTGSEPVTYYAQPMMFPLTQPTGENEGTSTRVLAFRVWMAPEALTTQPDAGGFHTAPVLGEAGAAFPAAGLAYGDAFSASDAGTDATSLRSYPLEDRDGQRMTEHLILTQIRVDLARSLKQRLQTRDLLL